MEMNLPLETRPCFLVIGCVSRLVRWVKFVAKELCIDLGLLMTPEIPAVIVMLLCTHVRLRGLREEFISNGRG